MFMCRCSSHFAMSTHIQWLFKLEKKSALRDFAAFHFMSTNKRSKKPFRSVEYTLASRKKSPPLKSEKKRRGGGRKASRRSWKSKRVTPLPIMSGSFKKPSSNCLKEKREGKGLKGFEWVRGIDGVGGVQRWGEGVHTSWRELSGEHIEASVHLR